MMKILIEKRLNGFTLVDILSSMAVISILIIAFFSYYSWLNSYYYSFYKSSDSYNEMTQFVESFQRDCGKADWIQYKLGSEELVMFKNGAGFSAYQFNSSEITLKRNDKQSSFYVSGRIDQAESRLFEGGEGCLEFICVEMNVSGEVRKAYFNKMMDAQTRFELLNLSDN